MSVLDRPDLVPVPLGFCPCAGGPHPDGDIVYLLPELPATTGARVQYMVSEAVTGDLDAVTVQERLVDIWLRVCVAEWTFLLDDGSPVPLTPDNVLRALPYGKGGRLVAEKADDLYARSIFDPLEARLSELSRRGSTASTRPATSRTRSSTQRRRSRS